MKAAFGGAFLIKLMLTFFILYIIFMSAALNYAKGFRVKNQIINRIEQNEGFVIGSTDVDLNNDMVSRYGYFVGEVDCPDEYTRWSSNTKEIGYCVREAKIDNRGKMYSVITYVKYEFPFFGVNLRIPIYGETKLIHTVS